MALQLKNLLHNIIHPKKNWKTDLLYRWHDIIGSLHNKVRIEKIYEDTLVLGVFHSCWMQELYLLSPLLIKTINENLDQPYIKQIHFKHSTLKNSKKNDKTPIVLKKNKQEIILTKQDECILAKIVDPALRNALKAFRIRCYQE
jgi:Dna[CI] antecedent, DciA